MAKFTDIDPSFGMTLTAHRREKTDDAALAQFCAFGFVPISTAQTLVFEQDDRFFDWLLASRWVKRLEEDLQCMANDEAGRPLLTTWLPAHDFINFVNDAVGSPCGVRLLSALTAWRMAGMEFVFFDGNLLHSPQAT